MSDWYGQPPADPNQPSQWPNPYPPAGSGYPPSGSGYPPPGPGYPPPGPGYPPPSSPAPGYPQQPPPAPGFPPPASPAAYPGAPSYGQPQQSPWASFQASPSPFGPTGQPVQRRSHGVLIALLVGLAVLLVAGGTGAFFVLRSNGTPKALPSASSSASPSPSVSPSPEPPEVTLAAPDKIGLLKKKPDQSAANSMKAQLEKNGVENAYAAQYQDSTSTARTVMVWGGAGELYGLVDEQKVLDGFFDSVGEELSGGKVGTRVVVSPGAVGGKAECAKVTGLSASVTITVCAWSGSDALLGFLFGGMSQDKSSQQIPLMLAAIVIKN